MAFGAGPALNNTILGFAYLVVGLQKAHWLPPDHLFHEFYPDGYVVY